VPGARASSQLRRARAPPRLAWLAGAPGSQAAARADEPEADPVKPAVLAPRPAVRAARQSEAPAAQESVARESAAGVRESGVREPAAALPLEQA